MKKIIIQVFLAFLSILVFAVGTALFFINYGGNRCGAVCDCFCCHMFNSRGYEACGEFGFYVGAGVGLLLAIALIYWWNNKRIVKIEEEEEEEIEFVDDPHEDIME